MAMFGPDLHAVDLATTPGIPFIPKKASDWPSLGHMPILNQSLVRDYN